MFLDIKIGDKVLTEYGYGTIIEINDYDTRIKFPNDINVSYSKREIKERNPNIKEFTRLDLFCKHINCAVFLAQLHEKFTEEEKLQYKKKCKDCYARRFWGYDKENR